MTRSFRIVLTTFIAIMMASLLAACGSTALPTNVPSATVAAGMQAIIVPDALGGSLSVSIPTGVKTETDGEAGLLTITAGDVAMGSPTPFKAGQWGLALSATQMSLVQVLIPQGQTPTPKILIEALSKTMAQTGITFNPAETTTIAGRTAARMTATSPQGEVEILAVDLTNSYLVMTLFTATGERAARAATIEQIASSAVYTPQK